MNYEKKYKGSLERARIWQNHLNESGDKDYADELNYIFPELAENEDERIIKNIISWLKNIDGQTIPINDYNSALAWLEKQGKEYALKSTNDEDVRKFMEYIEKQAKAYDFNLPHRGYDIYAFAKDILCWLEKQGEQKAFDYENTNIQQKDFAPKSAMEAIKEEKVDNANKVEPKFRKEEWLCENEPNNYARFIQILEIVNVQGKERYRISRDLHNDEDIIECRFVEDSWHPFTIQDAKDGDVLMWDNGRYIVLFKEIKDNILAHCSYNTYSKHFGFHSDYDTRFDCILNFRPATKKQRDLLFQKVKEAGYEWDIEKKELKKIEQPHVWSDEDERLYRGLHNLIYSTPYCDSRKELSDWLKSLKDRVQPQSKQEWSEEDAKALNRIAAILVDASEVKNWWKEYRLIEKDEMIRLTNFLKSLRPHNHWKPSDEQIRELGVVATGKGWFSKEILSELLEQLKKLKEE